MDFIAGAVSSQGKKTPTNDKPKLQQLRTCQDLYTIKTAVDFYKRT